MKIGELAKQADCEVETIRYYEREGLLPLPPRKASGYRDYGPDDVERLAFIRHCRSLDMSLDDVRVLQRFQVEPEARCDRINDILDRHLQQIETQILSLQHLQMQLRKLRNACQAPLPAAECGILQNLQNAASRHECACHADEH